MALGCRTPDSCFLPQALHRLHFTGKASVYPRYLLGLRTPAFSRMPSTGFASLGRPQFTQDAFSHKRAPKRGFPRLSIVGGNLKGRRSMEERGQQCRWGWGWQGSPHLRAAAAGGAEAAERCVPRARWPRWDTWLQRAESMLSAGPEQRARLGPRRAKGGQG